MSKGPTVQIVLKRAMDIWPSDVIRLTPNDEWRFVYNSARSYEEADTDEAGRVLDEELDGYHVLLRVSVDPKMRIGDQFDNTLHTWVDDRDLRGRPKDFGVPPEQDDKYVVLRHFDLVEVQTLVQTEPESKPERTDPRSVPAPVEITWDEGSARWGEASPEQLDQILRHAEEILGRPDTLA